jgi:hypothetical protein
MGGLGIEMQTKGISANVENVMLENSWLRLALILVVAPLLWLLLLYLFGQQIVLCWLVLAAAYIVTLLIGANANVRGRKESRRRLEVSRTLVAWLSPLFWGGILAAPYFFLYMFLFDRGNFFPR